MILIVGQMASGKSLYSSFFAEQGKSICEYDETITLSPADVVVTQRRELVKELDPKELHHIRRMPRTKFLIWKLPEMFHVTIYKREPLFGLLVKDRVQMYSKKTLMAAFERIQAFP